MNSIICVLCQIKEETCQHLFIECKHVQHIWTLCHKWLGILFAQHFDIKNHFVSFHLAQASSKQNLVWKGFWATIVRCIWDQRNTILFKQGVAAEEIFQ